MVRLFNFISRKIRALSSIRLPFFIKNSALFCEAVLIFLMVSLSWLVLSLLSWDSNDNFVLHGQILHNSIINKGGVFGAYVSEILLHLFGFSSFWFVYLLFSWLFIIYSRLVVYFRNSDQSSVFFGVYFYFENIIGFLLLLFGTLGLEAIFSEDIENHISQGFLEICRSGCIIGNCFSDYLVFLIGMTGSILFLMVMVLTGFSLFFCFSWLLFFEKIGFLLDSFIKRLNCLFLYIFSFIRKIIHRCTYCIYDFFHRRRNARYKEQDNTGRNNNEELLIIDNHKNIVDNKDISSNLSDVIDSFIEHVPNKTEKNIVKRKNEKLPSLNLLDSSRYNDIQPPSEDIKLVSKLIEQKLADFGVSVRVISAKSGPVITRYEIEPAIGIKGSQIVGLARDLARSLSVASIRVVETIPGKNLMGLELPNRSRQSVCLSEILNSSVYNLAKSTLTIALGKDIAGNPVVADLSRMPHLLVAGTTGSGKSVGINAMLISLLYKYSSSNIRLILIDPKMLEMSVYEGIPHLLTNVVTDMKKAANALRWCVSEMDKRYYLMSKMGVRNLSGYNEKIKEASLSNEFIYNPLSVNKNDPEPLELMSSIIVVIDELADLMMTSGKKIEELIARLAQKARAAGIHLILATQRPSVDVITGLIKANIPTRIAFQVSSKIDSRTILDQAGAESLLGQGDMLYLPPGVGFPVRIHGAFVSDDEVHRVVESLKSQGEANYIDEILNYGESLADSDGINSVTGIESYENDPMYDKACDIVLKNRRASISLVQRHLRIGYNRAARLLEQMEKAGIVSSMRSNGNREILVNISDQKDE
ncbi:S-DNA-T family DNA segregation ATPase FtsK/SpoIIIE [Candidatus Kinetoplastibacterium blastocrithidii TCC012E]|uniref:S-DNA-T family DNA segregation ATPase FtsK/SpoIIIE n=1 Tax=Candidatus Kinetoplastidibacterium blastocrithidiae TCC012E TaxID=1208922 RepID=M1M0Z1_9PROT|nr:DNA translocase FtsK [Candidatus Kinetoplastibacterium blastocrithidii]AFZ83821.1 DNA segregation ATPase FtsK/SpoIIIE, S-DNA-T family [Candidatus Kinetoplastibacterium blastocrithidii (ex Strigomonas culicis)]AGF49946.1 S-DNA-T family DNA segregation ATPase FtsK/SpoIIIE [Candidatus Kinetoplastibacterium blastocrithidii TCC012E]